MFNKKNKKEKEAEAIGLRDQIFGTGQPLTDETTENMQKIIESWLDDRFIHSKTRLTNNQIIALTLLKTLAEKYKITCIKEIIDNFCRYKLSEGGESSKELVSILQNRPEIIPDNTFMDKIKAFTR